MFAETLFLLSKKIMNQIPLFPPNSDFPSDVLKWMKKNNAKPKMVLKFMQICKYFKYEEFPYSVVINLWGHSRQDLGQEFLPHWSYQPLGRNVRVNVKTFEKPLWILDSLRLTKFDRLPEIAVSDLYTLVLAEVDMSFNEFVILTNARKVSQLYLSDSVIRDENGKVLSFEMIFECLPNINSHIYANSIFSYQEAANFGASEIREEPYNIVKCLNFFRNNQHIFFNFSIYGERDDEFTDRLQAATDKLVKAWSPKNKPPVIYFADQTQESKNEIKHLQEKYKCTIKN